MPEALPAGSVALVCAVVLLGQGLARDLWLKLVVRIPDTCAVGAQICAESAVGISAIVAGALLLASGVGGIVTLSPWRWAGLLGATLLFGYAIRDVVFDFRRMRFGTHSKRI